MVYFKNTNGAVHAYDSYAAWEIYGEPTAQELTFSEVEELFNKTYNSIPRSCSRRQGRLALLQAGYLDSVEQFIASIPDPVQRKAAEIEYESDLWERSNPFLQTAWQSLGGTDNELDSLFTLAVTL